MGKKKTAKDVMEPHSKAKVDFYQKYLERYISILVSTPFFKRINIFDVFCGRGLYEDGGHGSPLRAFDTIKDINSRIKHEKELNLNLNDKCIAHLENVKAYIDPQNKDNCVCNVSYSNENAEELLDSLADVLKNTDKETRNLIFIDPYGYKYIHKDTLEKIMSNGYTEILLFLPISFMYRFSNYAVANTNSDSIKPLKEFIESFFTKDHPIRIQEEMNVLEYIQYLTRAFSFGNKYYTTSYHIERDTNSYFALFFFSSNILGFNKILEVKWKLDEADGNGFNLPNDQYGLFDDIEAEEKKIYHYENLKSKLMSFLKEPKSNEQVFEFVLRNEYLPSHATPILKELQAANRLSVIHICDKSEARKGSFYISSDALKKQHVMIKIIS
mgnify:CR=1 FL=1